MPEPRRKSRLTAALITVRSSQEWASALRLLSHSAGVTISQLIRDALRTHVTAGIASGQFDELVAAELLAEDLRSSLLRQTRHDSRTKALARVTEQGLPPSGNDLQMIAGPQRQQQEQLALLQEAVPHG